MKDSASTAGASCPAPNGAASCDWCSSDNVSVTRCKVVCRDCKRISTSCADL